MRKGKVVQAVIAGSDGKTIYKADDTVNEFDVNEFDWRVKTGGIELSEDDAEKAKLQEEAVKAEKEAKNSLSIAKKGVSVAEKALEVLKTKKPTKEQVQEAEALVSVKKNELEEAESAFAKASEELEKYR